MTDNRPLDIVVMFLGAAAALAVAALLAQSVLAQLLPAIAR